MPTITTPSVRFPREAAEFPLAQVIEGAHLLGCEAFEAGSFLRGRETIHDLDVVLVVPDDKELEDVAGQLSQMLFNEPAGASRIVRGNSLESGIQIDLYLCRASEAGAMLMFLTGPAEFNIRCRQIAKRRGLKLNQYGLFDGDETPVIDGPDERAIFDALGMDYLSPEQREEYR